MASNKYSVPGMKNREERSKHFFDSGPLLEEDTELALFDRVRAFLNWTHTHGVKPL